jgi:hypothetical protein
MFSPSSVTMLRSSRYQTARMTSPSLLSSQDQTFRGTGGGCFIGTDVSGGIRWIIVNPSFSATRFNSSHLYLALTAFSVNKVEIPIWWSIARNLPILAATAGRPRLWCLVPGSWVRLFSLLLEDGLPASLICFSNSYRAAAATVSFLRASCQRAM